jgi:hypothetical protein
MDLGCLAPASRLKRAKARKLSGDGKALHFQKHSVSVYSPPSGRVSRDEEEEEEAGLTMTHFSPMAAQGVFLQKHHLSPSD